MKDGMRVAVVVLNYNGWKDTLRCIDSLLKQTYKNFQIILIDNGSENESVKELEKIEDKRMIFIENGVNGGFTGGVNIGVKLAIKEKFEAVALLNNDTVAKKDWLEKLVVAMVKAKAAIVTGLVLSADGKKIDDAGNIYGTWGVPILRGAGEPVDQAPKSGFIFGTTGAAVLYRTDLFKKIGFFDEEFFAYSEDIDVSWRTQLAGQKIYYEKTATVCHKHSATAKKITGFNTKQTMRNLPMVLWKNVPFPMVIPVFFKFSVLYMLFFGLKIVRGEGKYAWRGFWQGIKLLPHAWRERRGIQKNKKVDNKYIRRILYKGIPLKRIR